MNNNTQSFEDIRKAAENGDAEAQYNLGLMYNNGDGVQQDYAEALKWYHKAAEQGNADAQYNIGDMYHDGEGVSRDYAEAAKWYHKAAKQGHAGAPVTLLLMYAGDQGVQQGSADAMYNRLSADKGDAGAQFRLGLMYNNGDGVQQDYAEAAKWFHKAANQGDARAQYNLGLMYSDGQGVPQDYTEALKWYYKAAEQGHAKAQHWLGWMYCYGHGVQQDYTEALKWYHKAAGQGIAKAKYTLGRMCDEGEGVPQDYAEALKWYYKAAEQGYSDAQFKLGLMHDEGKGVQQNYAEALKWYYKAAEQGHAKAQIKLDKMKEEVAELDMHMGSRNISLDELIGEDGENSHMDFLVVDAENQEESLIKKEQSSLDKYFITAALSGLNEREKYIILNRVMADNPETLQGIGDKYNITQEDARQIEKQALNKMQQVLRHVVVTSSVVRRLESTEKLLVESSGKKEYICPITGAKFVLIPAGTFMMGSPEDEIGHMDDETLHQVTISKPFYLQTTPVTQRQWKVVMGNNPFWFTGEDRPVVGVQWGDIQKYIQKLNELAGNARYRLPTEAEWEYACRAGSNGRYCFGDDETMLGKYAWYYSANSNQETHPVGLKRPNAWGLYDMHGNVYECCSDWYGAEYYSESPRDDPQGPSSGEARVSRGATWDLALNSRAAVRGLENDVLRYFDSGFRIAFPPDDIF